MRIQNIKYLTLVVMLSMYFVFVNATTDSTGKSNLKKGGIDNSITSNKKSSNNHTAPKDNSIKSKARDNGDEVNTVRYFFLFQSGENDHGKFYNFIHGKFFLIILTILSIALTGLGVFGVVKHGGVTNA